ncbi:MAG: PilZ domain-containing protein [Plesiomonas sp.]|uniref:PilZ domain-containing protein n=1 Tax=Plesiomonas sp. TaxID=2486279 RepID=UPI003F40633B
MDKGHFFSVQQCLSVNISPLATDIPLPDQVTFEQEIPLPFRITAEIAHLDASSIRSLQNIGAVADDLVNCLQIQQQKIDLLIHSILWQEDQPIHRYTTHSFSAGGLRYFCKDLPAINTHMCIKIFLPHPAAAIYCYGEVMAIEIEQGQPLVQIRFTHLRDNDQDLLIRAALYIQQQQLKQRAELRVKPNL